jgi:hypothetical protein
VAFRDEEQLACVCRALLASVGVGRLWTRTGPTEEANDVDAFDEPARSMLHVVWILWNRPDDSASFRHLVALRFIPPPSEVLGMLIVAMTIGPAGVDAWLDVHGVPDEVH